MIDATARDVEQSELEEAPAALPSPAEPAMLSWEDIQARAEASVLTDTLYVPEWGGHVKIRGLYISEARDVWNRVGEDADGGIVACYTVAYGCVSPRIPIDEAEKGLGAQGAGVVFRLYRAIDQLTEANEEAAKAAAARFRDT